MNENLTIIARYKVLPISQLKIKWLLHIKLKSLSVWEKRFLRAMCISVSCTEKQLKKLNEVYIQYR